MSNVSGTSSGSSNVRARIVGVPKRCWCGEEIVAKNSKSDPNPCRRYFRCAYAATKKLMNDNHTFKWVDEALLKDVSRVAVQIDRLEEDMKETVKHHKMVVEKMQMELEKEIFERVEDVMSEFKSRMNKMMIVLVFCFLIMFGLVKLLGRVNEDERNKEMECFFMA